MRFYDGTIRTFNDDVIHNRIADKLSYAYSRYYHKTPSESEYRSWNQSLNILNNSFTFSGLADNKLIVEYELPYSTRRIDVLIFGNDLKDRGSVVLIELKQWSNKHVYDCENDGNVVVDFIGKKEVAHPCLQVQGYHYDLIDFLKVFQENPSPELNSCAYCHNYSRFGNDVLRLPKFSKVINAFPLFTKEDIQELGQYLKDRLKSGSGVEVFNRFVASPARPSKKLLDHTGEMIHKQQIFNLIDDQIAAYNAIIHKANHLTKTEQKSIVVVKGGPGTGKSVIALEVMGELMRQGKVVYHATGSSAFTNTLRKVVGRRASNLFKFFFNFTNLKENEIDVLICDEAHRIRAHSNDYGVPKQFKSRNPQVDDLIKPAKLSIFFLDEHQIVRPKEIGSISLIKDAAQKLGIKDTNIAEFELKTQFRCSGSDAYLQWLDKALEIRDIDMARFDPKMEFKIFDSPKDLKKAIDAKNTQKLNSSRIVAGFCWEWSAPKPDGTLVGDVKIGDFQMPWENKKEFWKWATDSSGMEQVGTVYTAQGFEFDYIGVIFGNDLSWNVQKKSWESVPGNSYDTQVTRNNKDLVTHLKHVYRVLLSRAHKGVYVYFMDESTKEYFQSRMADDYETDKTIMFSDIISKEEEFFLRIHELIPQNLEYKEYLPVFELEAACGYFGNGVEAEPLGWIKTQGIQLNKNMFVSKVIGKSMEPFISDGSYCVFRANVVGSRMNKFVLVQHNSITDPDTGGKYTVKKYTSKKKYASDGTWEHEEITLLPLNPAYAPITIPDVDEGEFMVIAEFITVLNK
ncbi:MAG: DNA/RNA helicase domain-containing protein [Candidatus Omnitrophota bacterium]